MRKLTETQIINKLKKELRGNEFTNFQQYEDWAGWQDWMEQYTTAKDLELCSFDELAEIQRIQCRAFYEEHEENMNRMYVQYWKKLAGIKGWWNKNVKPQFKTTMKADDFKRECMSEFMNTGTVEIRSCYTKTGNPITWNC